MRAVILLMDSFGIGSAKDAEAFHDAGSDTLGHICEYFAAHRRDEAGRSKPLYLPNLARLGLAEAAAAARGCPLPADLGGEARYGAYTYAEEVSRGKDTLSGHWELAGVPVDFDWGYFPNVPHCFPSEVINALIKRGRLRGVLGECHASGTEIIKELGIEHMRSGKPIVYTSADSVLQIAAHESSFGLERLYELCKIAFELVRPYNIARVIARPFIGSDPTDFVRTGNRHDYAVAAPQQTLLDKVVANGQQVYAVGKIADIFAHRGISRHYAAGNLEALIDATVEAVREAPEGALVFSNFVDFDSSFGHRRNVRGYGEALEYFDWRLNEITGCFRPLDLGLITADHGNDPTWTGTDHTRERVPVLFFGDAVKPGPRRPLTTFADMGATVAAYLGTEPLFSGRAVDL